MTAPGKRRNKSGEIGTKTAEALARWLQANGWPSAERRALHGSEDLGDLIGCPALVWQSKGGHAAEEASDAQLAEWLTATEQQRVRAKADYGILVCKRRGYGMGRAGQWWAVMHLLDLGQLLGGIAVQHPLAASDAIVRMTLAELAPVLRTAGYGTPLDGGAR